MRPLRFSGALAKLTSSTLRGRSAARATRPSVVASTKGTANLQARPA